MKKLTALIAACTMMAAGAAFSAEKFTTPVLITSAGQSIETQTVAFHFQKAEIPSNCEPLAKPASLEGVKTLVVVPGHSLKGLGSAGIDEAGELARIKNLLEVAKTQKIPVLCIHIGGNARRGPTSKPFIDAVLDHAKTCIVYEAGNEDAYFTTECQKRGINLILIKKAALLSRALKDLF